MATFIQTEELSGTVKPTGAGAIIRDAQFGIDSRIDGYILQNISINTQRTSDQTFDQKNCLVSELDTDEQQDCTITVIGGNGAESGELSGIVPGDIDFTFDNKKWKVRSVTFNGTYNDKKQYTINLFRAKNWPA